MTHVKRLKLCTIFAKSLHTSNSVRTSNEGMSNCLHEEKQTCCTNWAYATPWPVNNLNSDFQPHRVRKCSLKKKWIYLRYASFCKQLLMLRLTLNCAQLKFFVDFTINAWLLFLVSVPFVHWSVLNLLFTAVCTGTCERRFRKFMQSIQSSYG